MGGGNSRVVGGFGESVVFKGNFLTSAMFDVFGESVDFNAVIKLRLRWFSLANRVPLTQCFVSFEATFVPV